MSEAVGAGWAPKKPPPSGDPEAAPKPRRFWWRFGLAAFVIVVASAAATSIAVLNYFDSVAKELSDNGAFSDRVERALAKVDGGEPQNILILGSDKRAGAEFAEDPGRSDTTILLRLDPDKKAIAVLSIPRDLKVEIPGYGTGKFNEAYAYGGPKLTLQTVKEMTGLPINHVVNVDFLGFVQAVYAIGCVYTDIDRRYYHSNEGAAEQYAEINVKPGYQLLCGKRALEYVRYRHTDTDIVRSARQQDFISAARERISVDDLVKDVFFGGGNKDLIAIFTKYTTSDISDEKTMLDVLKLFVSVRSAEIKEVQFPAELGPSFVTATPEAINEAVNQFLGVEASGGATANQEGVEENEQDAASEKKRKQKKAAKKKRKKEPIVRPKPPGSDELVPAREAGEMEAEIAARRAHGHFPIYYPTRLPSGAYFAESDPSQKIIDPFVYGIKDESGDRHEAYRMVIVSEESDGTHYYGMQGIRGWDDPPILGNPSETKEINGREYDIFADSGRIRLIAWRRGENSYWVSNDLLKSLSNDQMVGMARSADVLVPRVKPKRKGQQ